MINVKNTDIIAFESRYWRFTDKCYKPYVVDNVNGYIYAQYIGSSEVIRYDVVYDSISIYKDMNTAITANEHEEPADEDVWRAMFGKRLYRLMCRRGYTERELANELGCGIGTMSRYTNGISIPTIRIAKRLAQILSCTVDYLLDV